MSFRTPTPDGLTVAPNASGFGSNPAASPQELENLHFWGRYELATQLPNVGFVDGVVVVGVNAAADPAYSKLAPGDFCLVEGAAPPGTTKIYVCVDRGTLSGSDARWNELVSSGGTTAAAPFNWNANGDITAFVPQAATFDGMAQNNAALSGSGPFDGQRRVLRDSTVVLLRVIQRAPAAVAANTTVEFYRLRGAFPGTVTSLGTVTVGNTIQFESATAVPGVADLLVDDILFVSFAAVPGAGAMDLSASVELS